MDTAPKERPRVEFLLVSGLHANEKCAPLIAHEVFKRLLKQSKRVELFEIPYLYTLLGFIDDPEMALSDYSAPGKGGHLDMDLEGMDEHLCERYPGALVFEFHNTEDTHPLLAINPDKLVQEFEVGWIGPGLSQRFEIGVWRNIAPNGRPGKFVIELPAQYAPVEPSIVTARLRRLQELQAQNHTFCTQWLHYLSNSVDVNESRRHGYLDDCIVQKVADWMIHAEEAWYELGGYGTVVNRSLSGSGKRKEG